MGPGANPSVLAWSFAAFAVAILVNYAASWTQETVVGQAAENVLSDMRRAMFAHLQRVSLGFMDKTEVGRLMSRLQGDVNSMQEFLETSVLVGRRHRAALRHRRRDGLARLAARPADARGDAGPLRGAPDLAAEGARGLHGGARDATRRRTARWPRGSTACARCRAWTASASTSRSTTTRRGRT